MASASIETLRLGAGHVYAKQRDGCLDADRAPRYDGGLWRIDRATGGADRLSRAPGMVGQMFEQDGFLWVDESGSYCQRFVNKDGLSTLAAIPLDGGAERRHEFPHYDNVGALLHGNGCVYYTRFGRSSDDATLERLDEATFKISRLARGSLDRSTSFGDYVYFVDKCTAALFPDPGEIDLCRVRRSGGDAEVVARDLGQGGFLRAGDDLIVPTHDAEKKASGFRVYSLATGASVDLTTSTGDEATLSEGAVLVRGTLVYRTASVGDYASQGLRAVPLHGGPSWRVAEPRRRPSIVVGDDRGVYWVDLDESRKPGVVDAVVGCEL